MPELAGFNTVIKISGAPTSMTGEATTTADDTAYQIAEVTKQVLDRDTAPTVLDGGVATAEAYTVNYLSGTVTFETADGDRVITITGKYLPMTVAAYANQSSQSYNCDVKDVPVFGAEYKKRIPTLKYASGSLTQFNIADTTYSDALVAGDPIVIEHRAISTDEPNRFWALLNSDELQSAIDGVQAEVVTWISTDAWLRLSV